MPATSTDELLREMANCLRKAGWTITPPSPPIPSLVITQWRRYGDDEDCLHGCLASSPDEVKARLCKRYKLTDTSDSSDPDQPGSLQIINQQVYVDNESFFYNGQQYRLRIQRINA